MAGWLRGQAQRSQPRYHVLQLLLQLRNGVELRLAALQPPRLAQLGL
jgi:hypothetical protein